MTDARTTSTARSAEPAGSLDADETRRRPGSAAGSGHVAHVPSGVTPIERLVVWAGRMT
jgi:hypothetical protein